MNSSNQHALSSSEIQYQIGTDNAVPYQSWFFELITKSHNTKLENQVFLGN